MKNKLRTVTIAFSALMFISSASAALPTEQKYKTGFEGTEGGITFETGSGIHKGQDLFTSTGDYGLNIASHQGTGTKTRLDIPVNASGTIKTSLDFLKYDIGGTDRGVVVHRDIEGGGVVKAGWKDASSRAGDPIIYINAPNIGIALKDTISTTLSKEKFHSLEVKISSDKAKVSITDSSGTTYSNSKNLGGYTYADDLDVLTYSNNADYALDEIKVAAPKSSVDKIKTNDFKSALEGAASITGSVNCALGFSVISGNCWASFASVLFDADTSDAFLNDLNADAGVIVEDRKSTLTNLDTVNDQSFGISQAKAKKDAVKYLNQGLTETEARNKILKDVNDFWSARQRNIVIQHQYEVQKFKNALANADATDTAYSTAFERNANDYKFYNETYELANGTETKVYNVYTAGGKLVHSATQTGTSGVKTAETKELFLAGDQYAKELSSTETLRSNAYDAVQNLVSGIYSKYQPGDLDPSGILGPLEALKTSATEYTETGGTSYLATTFEQMGLSTDFDKAFTVTYQNTDMNTSKTIEGQLFGSPEDFTNGFTSNTTYDATSKTAWMIYTPEDGGAAESVNFDNTFTVDKIQSLQTGEQLNNTVIKQQEFYTTNVTDLENQLQKLRQEQKKLTSGGGTAGGSSTGLFGLSQSNTILSLIVVVGIVVIAGRLI